MVILFDPYCSEGCSDCPRCGGGVPEIGYIVEGGVRIDVLRGRVRVVAVTDMAGKPSRFSSLSTSSLAPGRRFSVLLLAHFSGEREERIFRTVTY